MNVISEKNQSNQEPDLSNYDWPVAPGENIFGFYRRVPCDSPSPAPSIKLFDGISSWKKNRKRQALQDSSPTGL